MKYKRLFSEGKIGTLKLKNRVVMPAMGVGLANEDGTPSDEMISYYEERAKGGAGLIITEITKVNDNHGIAEPHQLGLTKDENINQFKKLTDAIHKHGTKIFPQLHHPGRQTYSNLIGGQPVVAPSAISCPVCQQETRALTTKEVKELIAEFVKAGVRAKKAGFDGVELHGAHGYLIDQFLSPYSNKRTDEYGGSFKNRLRFAEEIILGIKKECGQDFPVIIRLSLDEFLYVIGVKDKGINIFKGFKNAKHLAKTGADAINVSSGTYETMSTIIEPISFSPGWKSHLSIFTQFATKKPVIATNVIKKPTTAEKLLKYHVVDFVAVGRGHLADPEWANKSRNGKEDTIQTCISCLHCVQTLFNDVVGKGGKVQCALNPRMGCELEFSDIKKDGNGRVVVVVGAGPAGLQAAKVLALRGFKPIVLEKENEIGGQLQLANKPPKKDKINYFMESMEAQLRELDVIIKLNYEATVENIKALNPYAVFVATGAEPIIPPIEGVKNSNVLTPPEILSGKVDIRGKSVAVIGSGMTGLETSELLATKKNKLVVVEMLSEIGSGIHIQNLMDVKMRLDKHKVEMLASHKLLKIEPNKIVIEDMINNKKVEKQADYVVLSVGVKPYAPLLKELTENFENVVAIGDADKCGRIASATRAGFEEAYNLK